MGGSLDALYKHLKQSDDEHYSFSDAVDYRVSSGSLNLDLQMGGGLNPGINVFSGVAGGGKTSCALTFAANFQKETENSFVVYIKAEGRMSDRILKSTGVDTSKDKWFLYSGNIFENLGDIKARRHVLPTIGTAVSKDIRDFAGTIQKAQADPEGSLVDRQYRAQCD